MIGGCLTESEPDTCAVCLVLNLNPPFLSCHHNICQFCLPMVNKSGQVCCPICRKRTLVQVMEREREINKEYKECAETLKSDLKMMKNKLKKSKNMVEKYKEENDNTKADILKEKEELQRKRDKFMERIGEIDDDLRDLNDRKTKCDNKDETCLTLNRMFNITCENVEQLLRLEEHEILESIQEQRIQIEQLLSDAEKLKY